MSWGDVKKTNEPATQAQKDYLAKLQIELNGDICVPIDELTKDEAAILISDALDSLGDKHIHHNKSYYRLQRARL